MPIYEYACPACGKKKEVIQKIDAPAPEGCECGHQGQLVKQVSAAGFQLKGGGWYATDFKGPSPAPAHTCDGHCKH